MTFGLAPGKLGFKLGEVLVGLQSGTTDTPETISSSSNKLHTIGYNWNPDTLAYEVPRQSLTDYGSISPFTELSPENLAASVWAATASTNNELGTMGEKLNSAGGAADPWDDSRALTVTKFMGLK